MQNERTSCNKHSENAETAVQIQLSKVQHENVTQSNPKHSEGKMNDMKI